jgi:hypothetical protein
LFVEKRKERPNGVMQWDPETGGSLSGWKSGFKAFLLPKVGVFGMDGCQRRDVSLA